MEKSKRVLETIIFAIVSNKDAVKIDSRTDEMGVLLTLSVDKIDIGRIIGREGATANAIRTILRIVGKGENAHINLKIEEPEGGKFHGLHHGRDGID